MPDNDDGKFENRTYLYIRRHPADIGTEPLPSHLTSWESPDVTIIQPNGSRGGVAVAEQVNKLEVSVTNAGGIDAVDAWVQAFFVRPGTAYTPAGAVQVGQDFLTIPGYGKSATTFDWMPSSSEAGHGCLLGRVTLYVPPDRTTQPGCL